MFCEKNVFDFGNIEKNQQIIKDNWAQFRTDLEQGLFLYDNVEMATKSLFLRVFDDLHGNMSSKMQRPLKDIEKNILLRGTILSEGEKPNYSRMLPDKKYITCGNRFSPKGVEWLYLSVGKCIEEALECSRAECRANNKRFAYCIFEIDDAHKHELLVDLTISDHLSTKKINDALEEVAKTQRNKCIKASRELGVPVKLSPRAKMIMVDEIKEWYLKTYMKLLSEQIFLPLKDSDDKDKMYAPFQCLAQYFASKGYVGIVYKSTVSERGKNVVFFDKRIARPTGDIVIEEI